MLSSKSLQSDLQHKYTELANSLQFDIQDAVTPTTSNTSVYVSEETYTASSYVSNILCCILNDAIDQIHILGGGDQEKHNAPVSYQALEERAVILGVDDPIFDPYTADLFEVSFNKKKLMKVHNDSTYFKHILLNIRGELKDNNSFKSLITLINDLRRMRTEESNLFSEEKSNVSLMNSLKHILQNEGAESHQILNNLNEKVAYLKDKTEDILFENVLRVRYMDDWEKSRMEQTSMLCRNGEKELEETISQYKTKIEKEIRVNNEIEMYIAENQKNMEDDIDKWMAKYAEDSERRQTQIAQYKEKREDLANEFNEFKELFENHKKAIEDYLEHKEQVRIEEERMAFLNEKAIKIQAWWRGLMVRKKLGPFNPNKGKKGKGKGKDKDKKGGKKK